MGTFDQTILLVSTQWRNEDGKNGTPDGLGGEKLNITTLTDYVPEHEIIVMQYPALKITIL